MKALRKSQIICLFAVAIVLVVEHSLSAAPEAPKGPPQKTEFATFGGGCFWCMEALYERFNGVKAVVSGYAGGTTANPNYKQVCTGETGHAEVVQVEYDPSVISYDQLLEVFWDVHNPTTLNQQGNDHGTQYRSIILYQNEAQKKAAEASRQIAAAHSREPIVTEIVPLTKFYPAEDYHQDYFRKNPNAPYCAYIISPKLQKLEKHAKYRLQPAKP